jgi:hypothetical protein
MRTSRMMSAAVLAAIGFLVVGCGTPSLPHVGVSSPYYGQLKASSANSVGDVNSSDTFSSCSITGGPVTVKLGALIPLNPGPFFASINGSAAVELDSAGDSVTSSAALAPGDCFSVVVSSVPHVEHHFCGDDLACTEYDYWVSDGVPYIVTW